MSSGRPDGRPRTDQAPTWRSSFPGPRDVDRHRNHHLHRRNHPVLHPRRRQLDGRSRRDPGPFSGNGGDDILAVTAHWNPTNSPNGDYQVAVFGYTVPIDPAKTVASVTLPTTLGGGDGSGLQTAHIFAMAVGS